MKKIIVRLVIIVVVVISAIVITRLVIYSLNTRQKTEEIRKLIHQSFFKEKDIASTQTLCLQLLDLSPNDKEIKWLYNMINTYMTAKYNKKQEAIQKTREIRERARSILDKVVSGSHTPDERIKTAEDSLVIDPSYENAYQVMGYAYKDKNDYDKAFECFSKATAKYWERRNIQPFEESYKETIERDTSFAYSSYEMAIIDIIDPVIPVRSIVSPNINVLALARDSYLQLVSKGILEYDLHNYDNAIINFNKAIELKPDCADAYICRGMTYKLKRENDKATIDFNKAIEIKPNYAFAYLYRGLVIGNDDLAIADYTKAIELKPDYTEAYRNRGMAYQHKKQSDLAAADYTKATALKKSEFGRAIANYTKEIKLNQKNAAIPYYYRGYIYQQKGELDLAIADYTKAIELGSNYTTASAYESLGHIYQQKGEIHLAMANYTKSIELYPDYPYAYEYRGCIYQQKGEFDKAITDYTKAIELNPNFVDAYLNRGLAYSKKSELEKAIADGEMFLKLAPNNPAAKQMRDLIEQWKKELQNK